MNYENDGEKHKNFIFQKTCDIIGAMGKVMINESDATKTARNGSSKNSSRRERAHVDVSRGAGRTKSVEVKSEKSKNVDSRATKTIAVTTSKNVKPSKAADSQKNIAGKKPEVEKAVVVKRSPQISRYAKEKPANGVKIIAKEVPAKTTKTVKSAKKPEMGLVVRDVDPEIALLASRARSMERPKPGTMRSAQQQTHGRSMSGMLSDRPHQSGANRSTVNLNGKAVVTAEVPKSAEEDSKFSKTKSMLIGVGVALVVAVVGFAGIAIFGNKKNMCTINFESNGGTQIEGTEIVCGRMVTRPENPEKDGFDFEGWMLEGDLFDFDGTPLYKNATLVAKWRAKDGTEIVTVKFDTDGGTAMSPMEVAKGAKLPSLPMPEKTGYIFDDWYLGDEPYDFSKPVEGDMTLKAKWEKRATNANADNSSASSNKSVTGLTAKDLSVEIGKTATQTVTVLPSTAEYSLTVMTSKDEVVTCSIADKNVVSCTGKAAGEATIRVRDVNSGKFTQFTVTVPEEKKPVDDKPVINDPDPEPEPTPTPTPTPTPDPDPEPEPTPTPTPTPTPGPSEETTEEE